MHALFHHALTNAGLAAAAAIVALLLSGVRLAPAWRYGLWLIVLARLVAPPLVRWEAPVWSRPAADDLLHEDDAATGATLAASVVASREPLVAFDDDSLEEEEFDEASSVWNWPTDPAPSAIEGESESAPVMTSEVAPTDVSMPDSEPIVSIKTQPAATSASWKTLLAASWQELAIAIWATGAAMWFALAARRIVAFHRLVKQAAPAPADVAAMAQDCAERLGLSRCPAIRLAEARVSPLVWAGSLRPIILLPSGLWSRLTAPQQQTLLAHELAHVRRRDHWVRWAELAVLGLFWWYPLAWWARRRVQRAEEECCDARVLAAFPGQSRDYGRALLAAIDFLSADRNESPALASSFLRERTVTRRLLMILRNETDEPLGKAGWASLLAFGLVALAVTVYATQAQEPSSAEGAKTKIEDVVDEAAAPEPSDDGTTAETKIADEAIYSEEPSYSKKAIVGEKTSSAPSRSATRKDGEPRPATVEERLDRLEQNLNRLLEALEGSDEAGRIPPGDGFIGKGMSMRVVNPLKTRSGMSAAPPGGSNPHSAGNMSAKGSSRRTGSSSLRASKESSWRNALSTRFDVVQEQVSLPSKPTQPFTAEEIQEIRTYLESLDEKIQLIEQQRNEIEQLLEADRQLREQELNDLYPARTKRANRK